MCDWVILRDSLGVGGGHCKGTYTYIHVFVWLKARTATVMQRYITYSDTLMVESCFVFICFRMLLSLSNFDCQLCKTLKVWQVSTSSQSCLLRTKQEWNCISHPICGFSSDNCTYYCRLLSSLLYIYMLVIYRICSCMSNQRLSTRNGCRY